MLLEFNSLTLKQKKVYSAIETFIKQRGIPPTVREIGEMVGEKTPGAVQGILNRLEKKGVIKRELGMARSIQLVSADSQYITPLYIPEIKKISSRNVNDLFNVYNIKKHQPLSPDFIDNAEECFMIGCPDNSLADSGIKYGDILIICRTEALNQDDIILVVINGHVLLRRYNTAEGTGNIRLTADSELTGREVYSLEEVTIVGKLIGKYTKF